MNAYRVSYGVAISAYGLGSRPLEDDTTNMYLRSTIIIQLLRTISKLIVYIHAGTTYM